MTDVNTATPENDGLGEGGSPYINMLMSVPDIAWVKDAANGKAYMLRRTATIVEALRLGSPKCHGVVIELALAKLKSAPNRHAMQNLEDHFSSIAHVQGATMKVHRRVASANGSLYLDLADTDGRVVEVTDTGWAVKTSAEVPVVFERTAHMEAIPAPETGGSMRDLRPFLNLASEHDHVLVGAWLLGALNPDLQRVPLEMHGQQGSGKSTNARLLKRLIDPTKTGFGRAMPKDAHELAIAASCEHVLLFDNVGYVPGYFSDTCCIITDGATAPRRKFYHDDAENVFSSPSAIILTGLVPAITNGDLMDRSISIEVPPLRSGSRKTESQLREEFERSRPKLLGALLDCLVAALGDGESVVKTDFRRLDFARFATAAEGTMGLTDGAVVAALQATREANILTVLENFSIYPYLRVIAEECKTSSWSASPTDVHNYLNKKRGSNRPPSDWPANPAALSKQLRRMAPDLLKAGINVEFGYKDSKKTERRITFNWLSTDGPSTTPAGTTDGSDSSDGS